MPNPPTPSPSRISVHTTPLPLTSRPLEDPDLIQAVSRHVRRHVGPIQGVFHEQDSRYVHVDVHVVGPRPDRRHYTLVTSGMAVSPMRLQAHGNFEMRFGEVVIGLPASWPLPTRKGVPVEGAPEVMWPFQVLALLARLPHEYDTWLGWGHTVENGLGPWSDTYPGTPFAGLILLPAVSEAPGFDRLELPHGRKVIDFLAAWPLHRSEIDFKLQHGTRALVERLAEAGVTDVVDVSRPPCAG